MDVSDVPASAENYAEAYVGGISPVGLFLMVDDGANVLQLTTGNSDNSAGLIAWSCPTYGTGFGQLGDVLNGADYGSTYTTRLMMAALRHLRCPSRGSRRLRLARRCSAR